MADRIAEAKYVTEDELLALGSDARVEVVNGEIVEMSPTGSLHNFIAGNIYDALKAYAKAHKSGFAYTDGAIFYLELQSQRIFQARVPDVAFVARERIPSDWNVEKPFRGAPTLAVEVMSPDDDPQEVLIKVREYLEAGAAQVWVVYPRPREVHVYKPHEATVSTFRGNDILSLTDLLPGLTIPLRDVFEVLDLSK